MKYACLTMVFFAANARAQDADTTALYNLCMTKGAAAIASAHGGSPHPAKRQARWLPGWDDICDAGVVKYEAEKRAADAASEATNPNLKTARDAAKRLGIIPNN